MHLQRILAGLACFALATAAQATFVIVDGLGDSVEMDAGDIPGILDYGSLLFTEGEMTTVHEALGTSGIETDGRVTFVLAETDAGLSFMTLIDASIASPLSGGGADSLLGMTTVAPVTVDRYMNFEGDDETDWELGGGGTQIFDAVYSWDSGKEGDGFAWGGIVEGDAITFDFTDYGAVLDPDDPLQFVSYGAKGWEIVASSGFTAADQFAFSLVAVPAPGAVSLLAIALIAVVSRRPR